MVAGKSCFTLPKPAPPTQADHRQSAKRHKVSKRWKAWATPRPPPRCPPRLSCAFVLLMPSCPCAPLVPDAPPLPSERAPGQIRRLLGTDPRPAQTPQTRPPASCLPFATPPPSPPASFRRIVSAPPRACGQRSRSRPPTPLGFHPDRVLLRACTTSRPPSQASCPL